MHFRRFQKEISETYFALNSLETFPASMHFARIRHIIRTFIIHPTPFQRARGRHGRGLARTGTDRDIIASVNQWRGNGHGSPPDAIRDGGNHRVFACRMRGMMSPFFAFFAAGGMNPPFAFSRCGEGFSQKFPAPKMYCLACFRVHCLICFVGPTHSLSYFDRCLVISVVFFLYLHD